MLKKKFFHIVIFVASGFFYVLEFYFFYPIKSLLKIAGLL